jgi:type IV secretion system protein VirB9
MVNRHSIGEASNIVVVHKVHDRWILRLGDRALAIYNESYKEHAEGSPHSEPSSTGTAVPTIQRVVKPNVGTVPNVGLGETQK